MLPVRDGVADEEFTYDQKESESLPSPRTSSFACSSRPIPLLREAQLLIGISSPRRADPKNSAARKVL